MPNTANRDLMVALMPGLFVVLWATGFIGAKFGLPYAPPLKFLLWRFAAVIALMAPLALAMRAPWPRGAKIAHVAVAGILLQAGYLGGVFVSIDLGLSAGLSALIVGTQPILTAVAGPLIGERVGPRQWAGLALGFSGVAMVVWGKLGLGGFGWAAVAASVLALLSITAGTLYQKRYCGAQDLRTQSVVQFIAAGAVLLPLSLAFETRPVVWTGELVFALAWLVVVLSLGAITLLLMLIRRGEAAAVTSLMYLVPPVTALIAWLMFGEALTLLSLAGMAVTVAGVALVLRK
ncbi:MAG: DMT family transporter [Burkholderiales bacterium]|nr:DMT family transporter [Burkholderiales bacterium]